MKLVLRGVEDFLVFKAGNGLPIVAAWPALLAAGFKLVSGLCFGTGLGNKLSDTLKAFIRNQCCTVALRLEETPEKSLPSLCRR